MKLTAQDRASVRRWKAMFVASFLVAASLLWPTLGRFGDGDDAYLFYDAGLRSWGEILPLTLLPPGWTHVTDVPYQGNGKPAESPVFVFGRWRPFSQYVYVKALWTLGLSPAAYRVLAWLFCWLTAAAMGSGAAGALSLAGAVPAETMWALATLYFWSLPTLFSSTIPFFTVNVASLLFGLALGLVCRGGRERAPRAGEIAAAGVLAFLACQSHENTWWLLAWFGGYLAVLRYAGQAPRHMPRFWWPLALIAAHVLLYRSLLPQPGPNWTGGGSENYSFAPAQLWSRFSYFMLTPLNGLAKPLVSLLGADIFQLDVAEQVIPLAFALTVGSLVWIARLPRVEREPRKESHWLSWALAVTIGVGVVSILPYCIVRNLRFVYYSKILADLMIFAAALVWVRTKRPRGLVLLPWIFGCMITIGYTAANPSWLDWNANDSRQYVASVASRHPELSECSPERPCCLRGTQRIWGRNEWVMSYNLGQAAKSPAFFPEEWPGVRCEKHLQVD